MDVEIEGQKLTLFIDYDRDKLGKLSYVGKILYFEKRVRKILINPLQIMMQKEIFEKLEPEDGNSVAWLCIVSLICAGIEALGGFYKGKATKDSFIDFLCDYMDPIFKNNKYGKTTLGQCVRDHFRNGLAHGFSISQGGVEHFQKYYEIDKFGLQINPRYFWKDFQDAFDKYIEDLRKLSKNEKMANNFLKRFECVFIKGM